MGSYGGGKRGPVWYSVSHFFSPRPLGPFCASFLPLALAFDFVLPLLLASSSSSSSSSS